MNRYLCVSLFLISFLTLAPPASADVFAGKMCESGCDRFRSISIFGDTMNGNTEPLSLLGGPVNSGMLDATALSYDASEKTVLVSDFYGQKIHVFPADARHDTAPIRAFSNAFVGQPRNAVRASGHDEYIVLNHAFLFAFARTSNGNATALRMTTYEPSVITNASGLVYLPASDEVAIGDYEALPDNQYRGEVLFFPRTISGAPVPSRHIVGPLTQLGSFVHSIAVDLVHGELFVLVSDPDSRSRIVVFPIGANGNVAPLRVIGGDNTLMTNAGGIDYYAPRDELLVASGAYNSSATRVLGFARTAQGNVAPSRNISGSSTGVNSNSGWRSVLGVPLEEIFGNGFE